MTAASTRAVFSAINKCLLPLCLDYWASSACLNILILFLHLVFLAKLVPLQQWISHAGFGCGPALFVFVLFCASVFPDKRPFIVLKRMFWPWSRWLLWQHRPGDISLHILNRESSVQKRAVLYNFPSFLLGRQWPRRGMPLCIGWVGSHVQTCRRF